MRVLVATDPSHSPSPVRQEEVAFAFDELFFSRTDDRGIILSGNSVFQRISMYSWDELLKKPHNIIRHPDMPKAVFWLLWDTIKRKEPIGAYVKNKAKDGRYYWVFAIVTPIEGGYLSVRLKPSSPVFDIVQKEYSTLVAKEQAESIKPSDSGTLLLNRLNELGFPDYTSFMSTALSQEIIARNTQLRKNPDPRIAIFNELVALSSSLLKQAEIIFNAYSLNEYVPLNLRIQAAKLGPSGKTIDVLSNNYNVISSEIRANMNEFITSARTVADTIYDGLFLVGTAGIQKEVWEHFKIEATADGSNNSQEIHLLTQQYAAYNQKALKGLRDIELQAKRFRDSSIEMKRQVAALEVTRVMGKIETSRLVTSEDGLYELIDDLELFQKTLNDSLKEIEDLNREVQQNVETLLKVASK